MARLPNGCSRMLCALLQFGSVVSAVNRPSPATARTRHNGPRTALSKRFSSESSSTRSWPETMTIGEPIMSSQKIGPSSLASRARFCTGAVESSDSMLPTTGLVGGCGIGLSLLVDAIDWWSPAWSSLEAVIPGSRHSGMVRRTRPGISRFRVRCFASPRNDGPDHLAATTMRNFPTSSPESPSTPFDQLGADLFRLFLLRPVAAAAHQVFFEVGDDVFHAVGRRRRQHVIVLGHDHQRRHPHGMVDVGRALPVARHVAVPVDAARETRPGEGIDEHLLFLE